MTHDIQVEQKENLMVITKTFDAPREVVFSMFKNPEQLAKWWGPKTWPATIASFDFRPGGVWHYYMTGPDGTQAWGKATFQEIDEPRSFSCTDVFSDAAGTVNAELPQGLMTYTFDEQDGRTTLTATAQYQTADEVQKLMEMGMAEGVKDTWGQLEELLAAGK